MYIGSCFCHGINFMLENGFSEDHIKLLYDAEKEHNEKAWGEYFPTMLLRIDN